MRISRLNIQNFLSHSFTNLHFKNEVLQVQGRNFDHPEDGWSNGSGKSTPFYAVCWALYGRVPRRYRTKDDVIRIGADHCRVELTLVGPDGKLEIIRVKERGKSEQLSAWHNTNRVPGERDECQQNLLRLFGVRWEVFLNSIFLGPESKASQFLDAAPADRARMLSELINLAPFEGAAERCGREIHKMELRQKELIGILRQVDSSLTDVDSTIQRLSGMYRVQQDETNRRVVTTEAEINALEKEAMGLRERLKNPPNEDVISLGAAYNQKAEQVQKLRNKIAIISAKITANRPKLGWNCPSCNQPVTTDILKSLYQAVKEWDIELKVCEQDLQSHIEALEKLAAARQSAVDWGAFVTRANQRLEEIRALVYKAKSQLENKTATFIHQELERAHLQRKRQVEIKNTHSRELATLNDTIPVYKTIQAGLRSEIRNLLLDELRIGLTHHTAEYLQILAGHEFQVRFPQTTRTGAEKFEIEVLRGGKEPIVSPGEEYRVKLAILLAVRRVLQHSTNSILDFLIIDDPLFGVDSAGDLAFSRLVTTLSIHQPQIFITVPRPVEGLSVRTLFVEKTGAVSKVLEGVMQ